MSSKLEKFWASVAGGGHMDQSQPSTSHSLPKIVTHVTNGSSGDENKDEEMKPEVDSSNDTEDGTRKFSDDFPDMQHVDFCGIKCATMFQLAERSVRCFVQQYDDTGWNAKYDLRDGSNEPNALFLIHQWYVPSEELASYYSQLYQSSSNYCAVCRRTFFAQSREKKRFSYDTGKSSSLEYEDMDTGNEPMDTSGLSSESLQTPETVGHDLVDCGCYRLKCQVCYALRHWIRLFPMHFDANSALCRVVEDLQQRVLADGHLELVSLLDVSTVPSYAWLRNVSVRNPELARQISLSFDQWTPEEIAVNLTHIEYKMLRRITFSEYKLYASTTNLQTTPILQRSISVFNRLKKLQNFNTLMAVIGGLTHSALARLTKTHSSLPTESKKVQSTKVSLILNASRTDLGQFAELLSSASNFSAYRKAFLECRGFRIPIIGVHLKDLISLHSAMPEYDQLGKVNCRKLGQLAAVFSHLILDLERPHNLPDANIDLINTLKVSLDIRYKDEEIYELSLKREPRTLLNVYSSCPKPVVFADWAAGVVSIPDRNTVNKHIAAMVDAVFKHYDHDRDGYISEPEFASIAGNFPFIDPFSIIDADRDGKISKGEMKEYFINQHSTEFCRGFKHNFHETTFLAPTTCAHCTKLLWGWLRQGYKCKDCGLPVHRNCKDVVVAECRSRNVVAAMAASAATWKDRPTYSYSLPEGPNPPSQVLCSTQISSPSELQSQFPKQKKLFINLSRRQNRAVSTVSPAESPSPEPTPPPLVEQAHRIRLPKTIRRGSKKLRTKSANDTDDYRCQSPDILPALASEEVFEEESSNASTGNNDPPHPPS